MRIVIEQQVILLEERKPTLTGLRGSQEQSNCRQMTMVRAKSATQQRNLIIPVPGNNDHGSASSNRNKSNNTHYNKNQHNNSKGSVAIGESLIPLHFRWSNECHSKYWMSLPLKCARKHIQTLTHLHRWLFTVHCHYNSVWHFRCAATAAD